MYNVNDYGLNMVMIKLTWKVLRLDHIGNLSIFSSLFTYKRTVINCINLKKVVWFILHISRLQFNRLRHKSMNRRTLRISFLLPIKYSLGRNTLNHLSRLQPDKCRVKFMVSLRERRVKLAPNCREWNVTAFGRLKSRGRCMWVYVYVYSGMMGENQAKLISIHLSWFVCVAEAIYHSI